jgi:hypothetical protein
MLRRTGGKVLCQAPTALLQALVFRGNVKLHASPFPHTKPYAIRALKSPSMGNQIPPLYRMS